MPTSTRENHLHYMNGDEIQRDLHNGGGDSLTQLHPLSLRELPLCH